MELYEKIITSPKFKSYVSSLEKNEKDRVYCKHGLAHFLDVARIAYIENLEKGYGISKDYIYVTALLHDLGRACDLAEYDNHEEASVVIAEEMLREAGASQETISDITAAVFNHGNRYIKDEVSLSGLIYRADKLSRNCLFCDSFDGCNWPLERKNVIREV